jgi:hypothetical protein
MNEPNNCRLHWPKLFFFTQNSSARSSFLVAAALADASLPESPSQSENPRSVFLLPVGCVGGMTYLLNFGIAIVLDVDGDRTLRGGLGNNIASCNRLNN